MKIFLIGLMAFTLIGCASMSNRHYPCKVLKEEPAKYNETKNPPFISEQTFNFNRQDVFDASIEVLKQEGYVFEKVNLVNGIIQTFWLKRGKGYSKFTIVFKEEGNKTKVISTCRLYVPSDIFGIAKTMRKTTNNTFFKKIKKRLKKE